MQSALARLPPVLRGADRFMQVSDHKLCIFLPNLKTVAQAWLAANKVQQTLDVPFMVGGSEVSVRAVVGVAYFPEHAASAEELIIHADIAQSIARSRDVGQYVFQAQDRASAEVYSGFEEQFRNALVGNQLDIHYQPQIEFASGKCIAVEALLRWELAGRGMIPPQAIISMAEANGLIAPLTNWIVNTVLRHQQEWAREGIELTVSINVSGVSLSDSEFPQMIERALGTWQSNPQKVTLEITESSTINDMDYGLDILIRLKQMGLRLSVDDFGTGFSSLSYVKRFPLDELKIDKLFVQNMRESSGDRQIVHSVIDLAHNFELSVVAEGIENEGTYKELKKLGCDVAQGYLISKPLPEADFRSWIAKHKH
jgi:EAL domain-containing protein (putative c-di-GMP-specific phosphodiesterase class I)